MKPTDLGRMHYFPAAFAGRFADPTSRSAGKRLRDRQIWAARRDVPHPFRTTGDAVGHSLDDPRVYASPVDPDGRRLEELWRQAEASVQEFHAAVGFAAANGWMPAEAFVMTVVPFVAALVARHPRLLLLEGPSALDSSSTDQETVIDARVLAFARLADALTHLRRWSVVTSPVPLPTSDLGWQWLPGPSPGTLFVPTAPDTALLVDGGPPSYAPDIDTVTFLRPEVSAGLLGLIADTICLHAPTVAIGSSAETVGRALRVWSTPKTPFDPRDPVLLAHHVAAHPSYMNAAFLAEGAGLTLVEAWSLFLSAQHRFDCRCREHADRHASSPSEADLAWTRMQTVFEAATAEARRRREAPRHIRSVATVLHREDFADGRPPVLTVFDPFGADGPVFRTPASDRIDAIDSRRMLAGLGGAVFDPALATGPPGADDPA